MRESLDEMNRLSQEQNQAIPRVGLEKALLKLKGSAALASGDPIILADAPGDDGIPEALEGDHGRP